ncbi:tubulin delta chain-like [Sycon ciliatum]|uniref:tubulin delta chain-like n=1 Tax=Sycon ciliatum TaxID=27933 RepID=UPI0031F64017
MSVISLQIGQCGNQLGASLLNQLFLECRGTERMGCFFEPAAGATAEKPHSHASSASGLQLEPSPGEGLAKHQPGWYARCCMIDTEPKAIEKARELAVKTPRALPGWRYNPAYQVVGQRGAGNNWAIGFHEHAHNMSEKIQMCVRRACDACDRLAGFLVLMSLAGGTGSGVGTYTCALLRDLYPSVFILCVSVSPYSTGEVIVQNYNAVLALSRLHASSDGVLMLANDGVHKICRQRMALDKISLHNLNEVLAQQLSAVLTPCRVDQPVFRMADMCQHLCSHPDYKLLRLYSLPQLASGRREYSSYLWSGLMHPLCQMLRTSCASEDGIDWSPHTVGSSGVNTRTRSSTYTAVASLLISRGKGSSLVDTSEFQTDASLHCTWAQRPFQAWTCERAMSFSDKVCAVLSNTSACVPALKTFSSMAWRMYTSRAFLHQYTSHGMEESDFLQAFSNVEQTISNYESLQGSTTSIQDMGLT